MSGYSLIAGLILHNELVCHEGDELAVGRFIIFAVDIITKECVDVLDFTPCPGDFDGMAYGAFDFAGGCVKLFGDAGYSSLVMRLIRPGL